MRAGDFRNHSVLNIHIWVRKESNLSCSRAGGHEAGLRTTGKVGTNFLFSFFASIKYLIPTGKGSDTKGFTALKCSMINISGNKDGAA